MVAPWWPLGGPSEQGAFPLALDGGGGPDQPGLVGSVGWVAQGVDGLQAGAPLQAAAAVGEGVEGELAVVLPQATGSCNTQHGARLVMAPSEGHPKIISPPTASSNLDGAPSPGDHLSHPMAPRHHCPRPQWGLLHGVPPKMLGGGSPSPKATKTLGKLFSFLCLKLVSFLCLKLLFPLLLLSFCSLFGSV